MTCIGGLGWSGPSGMAGCGGGGGQMSRALMTDTDEGRTMGRMSWRMGIKADIMAASGATERRCSGVVGSRRWAELVTGEGVGVLKVVVQCRASEVAPRRMMSSVAARRQPDRPTAPNGPTNSPGQLADVGWRDEDGRTVSYNWQHQLGYGMKGNTGVKG